jgi:hypothetical protein
MDPFVKNDTALYVTLGLVVLYQLPGWGRRVLAFLRDWNDYRGKRPKP